MKKIISIIGARPQFIKHAPVEKVLSQHFDMKSIHTGQHYDENMSDIFFNQLKINAPTYMLNVGSGNHSEQTGRMMIEIDPILQNEKPDAVIVYGDTNSTLAGALVASKLSIPIIHVESGLRSFNREMPEEINRILVDHLSTILFVPSDVAMQNLKNDGITKNVYKIGDVMCDMLQIAKKHVNKKIDYHYYYATIHRPYNTDSIERLMKVLTSLNLLSKKVILSAHPRTRQILRNHNIDLITFNNINFIDPVSYFENISYLNYCDALLTDSGGMQKEAYILEKQCITIRKETEWVETLENGWNQLVFEDLDLISEILNNIQPINHKSDLYGDGEASLEIFEILSKNL
jgi:UDP-GlcNAc3NAcA epimerase